MTPRGAALRLLALLVALQFGASAAYPQSLGGQGPLGMGGPPPTVHERGRSDAAARIVPPRPVPVKIQPAPWPRLEQGALLCATQDQLKAYQAAVEAAAAASPPQLPAGCVRITERTAVNIVQRDGPARVLVQIGAPANRSGWTDAWLPDKPPS